MTSSVPALRIAIVGAGPRGLYALERLLSHAARHGCSLAVDVYDPTPDPGAGPVYDPRQPAYLRMNFVAGQVDAWWPGDGAVPTPLRRSLVAWLADADAGSDAASSTAATTAGHGGPPLGDAYVPRAVVGRYLHDAFTLVARFAPPSVRLRTHPIAVASVTPDEGRWTVAVGGDRRRYDEVLVTGAHRDADRRSLACGWYHAAPLVRAVFPVDRWLSADRVPPGSVVALRGWALTAIDAILALTEGRGGRFVTAGTPSGLRYEAGHLPAVTVHPYSRTGRPMRPKPEAVAFDRLSRRTDGAVATAIDRVPARPDGTGAVEILARTVGDLARAVLDVDGTTMDERDRLARWTAALAVGAPGPTDRAPRDELRQGHAVATGAVPLDAEAALGVAWRLVYPAVVERFGGAPLGADGWRAFRALAAELERVGFGPSAENVAKLLALVDAGFVVLDHVAGGRLIDRIGSTELRSDAGAVRVDRVIDGVLPGPGVARTGSMPLERLLDADHVARDAGQRGVRVDATDATALDAEGKRIVGLAAIGRSTEDATIGNDTLNRALHPQVDRWAERVVTRAMLVGEPSSGVLTESSGVLTAGRTSNAGESGPSALGADPRPRPGDGPIAALDSAVREDSPR